MIGSAGPRAENQKQTLLMMALEATRSRLAERSKTDGDEARSEPVESSKSTRDAWVISSRGTDRLPSDASASASRSGNGPLVSLLLDPTESDPGTTSFGCVGAGVCVCFGFRKQKKKKKTGRNTDGKRSGSIGGDVGGHAAGKGLGLGFKRQQLVADRLEHLRQDRPALVGFTSGTSPTT